MKYTDEQSAAKNPGTFISFEGGEGAGKSTHIRFLAQTLEAEGYEVLCLREPGGTHIGEKLRDLVLDTAHGEMANQTELFVYEAARAQIVAQVIKPALDRGAVVLCDRFYDSTVAYQVYGRGLDEEFVTQANAFACQGIKPERTILLSCGASAKEGLSRATHRVGADRLEQAGEDFHTRVNDAFFSLAQREPERIRVVVSAQGKHQTARAIFSELVDIFPWMQDEARFGDAFFAGANKVQSPKGEDLTAEKGEHIPDQGVSCV